MSSTLLERAQNPVAPPRRNPAIGAVYGEGYLIDAPFAATALAEKIAGQSWTGLFVAFDYGKSWRELIEAAPAGTARAYHRHTQSNDLLARAKPVVPVILKRYADQIGELILQLLREILPLRVQERRRHHRDLGDQRDCQRFPSHPPLPENPLLQASSRRCPVQSIGPSSNAI